MNTAPATAGGALQHSFGFGNEHQSEAVSGALPLGQNSPQRAPLGLLAEQLSATAFTAPRHANRRTWVYRVRPSAAHGPLVRRDGGGIATAPLHGVMNPNRVRWNPLPAASSPQSFVESLVPYAASGDARQLAGCGVLAYQAATPMAEVFADFDGELLIVPEDGVLDLRTELGLLRVQPGEFALVPRGVRFQANPAGSLARGYVCENHGQLFALPELGPIGANGLANARDFRYPVAWFDADHLDTATVLTVKSGGQLWDTQLDHSPFDVVAWHGSLAPCAYDLAQFNAINTVSFDHCDPSIFTVLTSPSAVPGTANVDFVVFPPRWSVADHTFRPPWFHRNVMSEFMGLVRGTYDAKADGFVPGGASMHNALSAHGPDLRTYEVASAAELGPQRIENTLAFMFESGLPFVLSDDPRLDQQADYDSAWAGFTRRFQPG